MKDGPAGDSTNIPDDLQTQLEELLGCVWAAEADWRLDDRISLAVSLAPPAPPPAGGRPGAEDPESLTG